MEIFSKTRESMNKSSSKKPKSVFQRTLYFTPHFTEGRAFFDSFSKLIFKGFIYKDKNSQKIDFEI